MRAARYRYRSALVIAVLVAIGCGGGKSQDAGATTEHRAEPERPKQLAQATAEPPPAAAGTGASIRGAIRFQGAAPSPEKIKMDADPVCQQQHQGAFYGEEVVVNPNGTLKNVFVYVKEGLQGTFPAPTTPVVLDQQGCWYQPHVFGIQANQPIEIVNSDATLHNVNVKPTSNQPFNVAQPAKGMKTTKKFTKPERMVKFKCNVHPWMHAYAGVLEHPFFSVSGEDGAFAITGLPAGSYVVEAWHEKYGVQTQSITMGDSETRTADFTFKAQ